MARERKIPTLKAGRYEITEDGRIYDTQRSRYKKVSKMGNGTYNVTLLDGSNKQHTYLLPKLIFYAFTGQTPARNEVIDHIDGDKSNCSISNLRLISRSELMNKVWANRRMRIVKCNRCGAQAPYSPRFVYHLKHCNGKIGILKYGSKSKLLKQKQNG